MTRIIWALVKSELLEPFIDLKLERYDLYVPERDRTDDQVTVQAAEAIRLHGVGVEVRDDHARRGARPGVQAQEGVAESQRRRSAPLLDGTVFRKPIAGQEHAADGALVDEADHDRPPRLRRHRTRAPRCRFSGRDASSWSTRPRSAASRSRVVVHDFHASGDRARRSQPRRARSARSPRPASTTRSHEQIDLWFGAQGHHQQDLSRHLPRDLFAEEVESRKADFDRAGITYQYMLIDDAVARADAARTGGFLWALHELRRRRDERHDRVRVRQPRPDDLGAGLARTATSSTRPRTAPCTRHYYQHQKGQPTSTNSTATIFAWTGAIAKRGELDDTPGAGRLREEARVRRDPRPSSPAR